MESFQGCRNGTTESCTHPHPEVGRVQLKSKLKHNCKSPFYSDFYMQTSKIKPQNETDVSNRTSITNHSSYILYLYLFYIYIFIFSTIVKSFNISCCWNCIVQIKIKLVLTFKGPNNAGNHKKSQLIELYLSVQPNVHFIPWIWNYVTGPLGPQSLEMSWKFKDHRTLQFWKF